MMSMEGLLFSEGKVRGWIWWKGRLVEKDVGERKLEREETKRKQRFEVTNKL